MPENTPKPEDTAKTTTDKDLDEVAGGVPTGQYVIQGHPPDDNSDGQTPQDSNSAT